MLLKSLSGYALALLVGVLVYRVLSGRVERSFLATADRPPPAVWVVLQWLSTGFLWSQWLIQDLANIFVYLPRQLSVAGLLGAVALMLALHAIIFYRSGGAIQRIVTSKTNTRDIRSATIVDFIYGWILLFFKELSSIPMSTTWVFLGLLAGRELAMTAALRHRESGETRRLVVRDASRAFAGLAASVILAFGLPVVHSRLTPAPAQAGPAGVTASAPGGAGHHVGDEATDTRPVLQRAPSVRGARPPGKPDAFPDNDTLRPRRSKARVSHRRS
jgi:hypothetical protein